MPDIPSLTATLCQLLPISFAVSRAPTASLWETAADAGLAPMSDTAETAAVTSR